MSKQVHEELDRLLGIEPPKTEAALAEEHGVTNHAPVEHLNSVSTKLAALLVHCSALPSEQRIPVVIAGLAKLVRAAGSEGPGVVAHLADELLAGAVQLLPAAPVEGGAS